MDVHKTALRDNPQRKGTSKLSAVVIVSLDIEFVILHVSPDDVGPEKIIDSAGAFKNLLILLTDYNRLRYPQFIMA
jgi:hypothetical protein